jgi:uncharacterized membrane protein YeaQ/YmgE (transglycosylase-associated protein family)
MSVLTWIVAGGVIGWAASYYMRSTQFQAVAFNIGVAVVGAAIGGYVLGTMLGVGPGFGVAALVMSSIGSAVLLVAVHFVQQRRAG